ncbi:glycosyltransferase, partial [Dehalococcoidia bacterium]|nr:glycosyltransferase [Dehalococcoidia bacterium]
LGAGLIIDRYDPSISSEVVRSQHGLEKEDIILFFMGWLYNFSGLKEVASQLAQIENDKIKLLIVGDGDAYGELQQIQDKYNLQNKLILTGKKPYQEIPSFIAASDVCLLPAYPDEPIMQDIVPIKMYEYMAMKKPVISTKLPGVMKEFGEDNGVVYVDRPEGVVAKALELVQNSSVPTLGSKARSFVERNSWDNITDEFEKILEQVIKEKGNERISKRI